MLAGWRIVYGNRGECYEEVPETWEVRNRQIRRWAIGHTQCFFAFARRLLTVPGIRFAQRIDGVMLLATYLIAPLLVVALAASLLLLLHGELLAVTALGLTLAIAAFSSFGNFASFFEIGTAVLLDGSGRRVRLLPLNLLNFAFSTVVITEALITHAATRLFGRRTIWQKTERFRT